jgi:hypothetical protein
VHLAFGNVPDLETLGTRLELRLDPRDGELLERLWAREGPFAPAPLVPSAEPGARDRLARLVAALLEIGALLPAPHRPPH